LTQGTGPVETEIRNPKSETRNKSEVETRKVQNPRGTEVLGLEILNFEFVSDFGFRISSFELSAARV